MKQLSQLPYPGGSKLPEAPAAPNNILFVENLPHECTPMMLQMLFCQYPGFKEVRMVETKPGIAFVEYGDEIQSTVSMQALQGFKMTAQNPMINLVQLMADKTELMEVKLRSWAAMTVKVKEYKELTFLYI
ncbi:hypothetical protein M5K25_000574 [Dendrobium thyrsiflorum]|uniref:RRM domain-containing protein n=1 Tax=Dendrobium thyrsiflorum TaxID=117978 RepID=A0ABD0VUN6_DENTH